MSDMAEGDDNRDEKKRKPLDGLKDTIRDLNEATDKYGKQTKRSIENDKRLREFMMNNRMKSPYGGVSPYGPPFDPVDAFPKDFQQKNASSDAFEFAWGIAKGDNAPTNPSLWSQAKSKARAKFDVYPSAYANAWASKWYKSKGGGWKKKSKKGKK